MTDDNFAFSTFLATAGGNIFLEVTKGYNGQRLRFLSMEATF